MSLVRTPSGERESPECGCERGAVVSKDIDVLYSVLW
jgi:hypothetical protein